MNKISKKEISSLNNYPLGYISYSCLNLFATNPLLFKIRYINKEQYDTTTNISAIVGQAFHRAMEVCWGVNDDLKPRDESEAIELGLQTGLSYIETYEEGWINWSSTIPNRQKAFDVFTFAFNSYIKEKDRGSDGEVLGCEIDVHEAFNIHWNGNDIEMPISLRGIIDKVVRRDGRLVIIDYKTTSAFTDPEKIDARKMIQAVQYYLLAFAYFGEEPYSICYEEIKYTKNRNGGSQVLEYEVVFSEHSLYFELYFRLFSDVLRSLAGEAVYVPNFDTFFDNEVGIMTYIYKLDFTDTQEKLQKKYGTESLTELLKLKINEASKTSDLMKVLEKKFVSAKTLNYEKMKSEEKIQKKLMEHGIVIQFHKKIEGASVDLYQYIPSIGIKMSRIMGYSLDIEQVLGVSGVRVLAPIPNSSMIGFEVPRAQRYFPALPEHNNSLGLAIGLDVMGEVRRFDIREAPHLLVAGATGSGKSVFLNSLIEQLIVTDNVELHLFDPKMVELIQYCDDAVEYATDHAVINNSLEDLIIEMEERYQAMKNAKVRNISQLDGYKYKIVIIDEFGDLILNNRDVERNVLILAQKARAAGIHLIIATQRPSTDIIKGTIKANFPTKVLFRTAKEVDSYVMIDQAGGEKLLGKGDMLFASDSGIERLQGFNV